VAEASHRPVLYVVACGGRPAADLPPFVTKLQADGWEVCVIATPSALKFMDTDELAELTGHVVRYDYKQPDEPDALPPPDAMVVAPATFNTTNKWAYGSSDTLALGLLNEAIGLGLPVVAVPSPSTALAKHPAFVESVARLRSWGCACYSTRRFTPSRHRTWAQPPPHCSHGRHLRRRSGPFDSSRIASGPVGSVPRGPSVRHGHQSRAHRHAPVFCAASLAAAGWPVFHMSANTGIERRSAASLARVGETWRGATASGLSARDWQGFRVSAARTPRFHQLLT